MSHDLVIRGGTIVDGTGSPQFTGDVAIDQDRITEVGKVAGSAKREIDAAGKLVTPGFVDIHTHLDAQIAWDPNRLVLLLSRHYLCRARQLRAWTFAPCKEEDRDYLANLMESVEDIPADSIRLGVPFTWETYGEYLSAIDGMDKGINFGGMVGHCAVRYHAMGETLTGRRAGHRAGHREDDRPGGRGHRCGRVGLLHLPDLHAQGAGTGGASPAPTPIRKSCWRSAGCWASMARACSKPRPASVRATKKRTCRKTRAEVAWMGENLARETSST